MKQCVGDMKNNSFVIQKDVLKGPEDIINIIGYHVTSYTSINSHCNTLIEKNRICIRKNQRIKKNIYSNNLFASHHEGRLIVWKLCSRAITV